MIELRFGILVVSRAGRELGPGVFPNRLMTIFVLLEKCTKVRHEDFDDVMVPAYCAVVDRRAKVHVPARFIIEIFTVSSFESPIFFDHAMILFRRVAAAPVASTIEVSQEQPTLIAA